MRERKREMSMWEQRRGELVVPPASRVKTASIRHGNIIRIPRPAQKEGR